MENLKKFLESLDQQQKEIFDVVVNEIGRKGSTIELQKLSIDLNQIKEKIGIVNKKREQLSQERNSCKILLENIDLYLEKNKNSNELSLYALRIILSESLKELNDEILLTKPIEFLSKKYKIKKTIETRRSRNDFITKFLTESKNG